MTDITSIRQLIPRWRSLGVWAGLLLLIASLAPSYSRGQASAPETAAPQPAVDQKLELIGSLASSHVYTTFGYIGVVADNTQKELYTPQRVDDLMREVTVISNSLIKQLEELQKSSLTESDAAAVQEIIEIYKLLNQEADALRAYAQEKNEPNGNSFNKIRGDAWVRVAKLVGIPAETPSDK
jgi:hypothetical protein